MIANIIQIGNSKGIRIPKPVLEQCGLSGKVELDIRDNELVIHPLRKVRQNWNEAFKEMSTNQDDLLIFKDAGSSWDEKDWEWK